MAAEKQCNWRLATICEINGFPQRAFGNSVSSDQQEEKHLRPRGCISNTNLKAPAVMRMVFEQRTLTHLRPGGRGMETQKEKPLRPRGQVIQTTKNTGDQEYVLLFDEHDKHGGHEDVFGERKKHTQAVTKEPAATPTPVANRVCLIRTLNYRTIPY